MMSIDEEQKAIIEEFEGFDDWMDKYQYIIDIGNALPSLDETYKKPQFLIEGCQSRVWLHASFQNGLVMIEAESDAVIVKGIVMLLIRVLNARTPDKILESDLFFIDEIGLKDHLSPTRANGLVSMVRQIKNYAMAFKLKGA